MTVPTSFYFEQADNCAKAAAEAALPNQRAIFLRAQLAWTSLADRKAATAAARVLREVRG